MKKSSCMPASLCLLLFFALLSFQCSKSGNGKSLSSYQTNSVPEGITNNDVKDLKPAQISKKSRVKKKVNEPLIKKSGKNNMEPAVNEKKTVTAASSSAGSLPVLNESSPQTNQIMKDGEYFIKFYQKSRTNIWIKKDLSNKPAEGGEKEEGVVGEEGNVLYQKVTQ